MQHTGHSSPLGAMTRFNPDEMWKKCSPSLETGENFDVILPLWGRRGPR